MQPESTGPVVDRGQREVHVPIGVAGSGRAALAFSMLLIAACGGGGKGGGGKDGGGNQAALQPPEVFRFVAEPISFSPLAKPWNRDRPVLKQGLTGVHFELGDGVAAEIDVGQYPPPLLVGARECLRAFNLRYAELSFPRAQDDMQKCRPPREPANDREASVHRQFTDLWDEAFAANGRQDRPAVQGALAAAVAATDQFRYEIEDVATIMPYKFDPARHEGGASSFADLVEEPVAVGGQPALSMSFRPRGRDQHERWVYVLSPGSNVFALHYLGNEVQLATFDSLVASVTFPGSP
jgi:hypothetical protein